MLIVLRIAVGVLSAIGLAGFALIVVVGKGLRSAYRSGAGSSDLMADAALVAIPLLLLAILASVFTPQARRFLHGLAVAVTLAAIYLATQVPDYPGEMAVYLGYFALWGVYYAAAVWGRRGAKDGDAHPPTQ